MLRAYYQTHRTSQDIAIELPTGAGKTLVGLLIAEWRRQAFGERVAYLCPTRQLAKQVGEQARDYGIPAKVLIGKQIEYPPQRFADYQSGRAIAVTTYSGIFNVNPRIDSPQTLVLDDAHAGENFIAGMWSVEVSRSNNSNLYHAILNLIRDALDASTYADLAHGSNWEPRKAGLIELIPGSFVRLYTSAIRDLLDEKIEEQTSSWYAWNEVKSHLSACSIFVSWEGILIRPLMPPTHLHHPFIHATQRVYMSATLGLGGELERVTGIKKIERLPLPPGWEYRGSGRRFFLMPEMALSDEQTHQVIGDVAQNSERTLVLIPGQHNVEGSTVVTTLRQRGMHMLQADDIEDSLEPFLQGTNSFLVLSRYDGLDLPDEACRQVILAGLPSGTNLQEKFFWSGIGAYSLLRDRVLTRFTQGVGRCTRSDNDYASVLVVGRRLIEFLLKKENTSTLHPELQAEIEFGFENSRKEESDGFADLWEAFMEQGENWMEAEDAIVALRQTQTRVDDPVAQQLQSVVADEIGYLYARWEDDLERALKHAKRVSDALTGNESRAYRAWWHYLSADTAIALCDATGETTYRDTADDYLRRASACCPGIAWFARIRRSLSSIVEKPEANELNAMAVEAISEHLTQWGTVGPRFEQSMSVIENALQSTSHKTFHQGLKGLGQMLGFEADLASGNATPDCIWSLGSTIYVAHEAKSEHKPTGNIGVNDIRQSESHRNWVKANLPCNEDTKIFCLIESPRTTVMEEALPHAGELFHMAPTELQELFGEICAVLRQARAKMLDLSGAQALEHLLGEIESKQLSPEKILQRMQRRPVSGMAKSETDNVN